MVKSVMHVEEIVLAAEQEVTLNHEAFEDVVTKGRYYGVTTGRVANRIRDGKFTVDGKVRCLFSAAVCPLQKALHSVRNFVM